MSKITKMVKFDEYLMKIVQFSFFAEFPHLESNSFIYSLCNSCAIAGFVFLYFLIIYALQATLFRFKLPE